MRSASLFFLSIGFGPIGQVQQGHAANVDHMKQVPVDKVMDPEIKKQVEL